MKRIISILIAAIFCAGTALAGESLVNTDSAHVRQSFAIGSRIVYSPQYPENDLRRYTPKADRLTFAVDWDKDTTVPWYAKGGELCTPGTHYVATRSAANPKTYSDATGLVITYTTSNQGIFPKGVYNPNSTFINVQGLSLEGSKTNLALYSNTPENAAWTKTNITADNDDPGSSSPDGTATANSLTATADNGTFVQQYTTSAAVYTASVWIKRKTGTGTISFRANAADAYTDISANVTTSWRRVKVTSSSSANPTFDLKISTNGDAVYVWGMQLEQGLYASSYIPVPAGTAIARNAESLSYPAAGNFPDRTGAWGTSFDGSDDIITFGNVGNINHVKIKLLSRKTNQKLFTINNTTNGSVYVSGGTLTFGAGLSASNITVDGVSKTAEQAGALINVAEWHTLEFDLTSVAASNFILGTDSSAFGNIIVQQLELSNPVTHSYNFTEGGGTTVADSTGNVNGTFGASTAAPTWTRTEHSFTVALKYAPIMMPNEQDMSYKNLFTLSINANNSWSIMYRSNADNQIDLISYSNGNYYNVIGSEAATYCSTWSRYSDHTLIATGSTTPFVIAGLNGGNPIRMALFDNGVPIAYSTTYVPPVGALPATFSIQSSSGQAAIYKKLRIFDDNLRSLSEAVQLNASMN